MIKAPTAISYHNKTAQKLLRMTSTNFFRAEAQKSCEGAWELESRDSYGYLVYRKDVRIAKTPVPGQEREGAQQ